MSIVTRGLGRTVLRLVSYGLGRLAQVFFPKTYDRYPDIVVYKVSPDLRVTTSVDELVIVHDRYSSS